MVSIGKRVNADRGESKYILYRWWDASGRLLYVGKSISLYSRISQHRNRSGFFNEATTMTIERLESAEQLAAAEMQAIKKENPLFNIAGGRHRPTLQTRSLVVSDADPTVAGYWAPIDFYEISYGDLVRWAYKSEPGQIIGQGIVDDFGISEDGEPEWYLFDAEAERVDLGEFISGLCIIQNWVHPAGDPTIEAYKNAAGQGLAGVDE